MEGSSVSREVSFKDEDTWLIIVLKEAVGHGKSIELNPNGNRTYYEWKERKREEDKCYTIKKELL